MTATGRVWLAIVALVSGVALIALGSITHDAGATAPGGAMVTLVLGYAFGDRNGEKRLAAALTVLQADERTPAPAKVVEPAPAPTVVETPATIVTTTEVKPTKAKRARKASS